MNINQYKFPALFITHGAPSTDWDEEGQKDLQLHWTQISNTLPKPKAILIISAHWEEQVPTIITKFYEKKGRYTAKISESLNKKLEQIFKLNSIDFNVLENKQLDHGAWIPLEWLNPQGDIPIFQLSLCKGLNVDYHIKLGEIISQLQSEGVLIIGSGATFHNISALIQYQKDTKSLELAKKFTEYLKDVCINEKYQKNERYELLKNWKNVQGAEHSHPSAEHLAPLFVILGTGNGNAGIVSYEKNLFGYPSVEFQFQ